MTHETKLHIFNQYKQDAVSIARAISNKQPKSTTAYKFLEDSEIDQKALITLWNIIEEYDAEKSKFSTFLFLKIKYALIDELRSLGTLWKRTTRKKNRIAFERLESFNNPDEEIPEPLFYYNQDLESKIERSHQRTMILSSLVNLTPAEKDLILFLLTDSEGRGVYKRYAQKKNVTDSAVAHVKRRAFKKLRSTMKL